MPGELAHQLINMGDLYTEPPESHAIALPFPSILLWLFSPTMPVSAAVPLGTIFSTQVPAHTRAGQPILDRLLFTPAQARQAEKDRNTRLPSRPYAVPVQHRDLLGEGWPVHEVAKFCTCSGRCKLCVCIKQNRVCSAHCGCTSVHCTNRQIR